MDQETEWIRELTMLKERWLACATLSETPVQAGRGYVGAAGMLESVLGGLKHDSWANLLELRDQGGYSYSNWPDGLKIRISEWEAAQSKPPTGAATWICEFNDTMASLRNARDTPGIHPALRKAAGEALKNLRPVFVAARDMDHIGLSKLREAEVCLSLWPPLMLRAIEDAIATAGVCACNVKPIRADNEKEGE